MSTTAAAPRPPELLQTLYAPIAPELWEVESLLKAELRSDDPFVDELVRYGNLLGGKRLRPALLLLTARAVAGRNATEGVPYSAECRVGRELITLAAVVEMIHTATLVHDDVLDEAQMRRHLSTVNARWDNEASVLLGDFLFTHAFYLASTLEGPIACRLIGRATNHVCEGELRQKGSRGNFSLTEKEYIEIVEAKTAALTAVSCRLGALFSGASEQILEQMDAFGRDLGIAFQIADDLLDVLGEERVTGKSLGTDLEKQKPTLPIIRALQLASPADRQAILDIASSVSPAADRPVLLRPYFDRYGAVDYTRRRARQFSERARRRLDALDPSPSRDILAAMTDFVVNRPS